MKPFRPWSAAAFCLYLASTVLPTVVRAQGETQQPAPGSNSNSAPTVTRDGARWKAQPSYGDVYQFLQYPQRGNQLHRWQAFVAPHGANQFFGLGGGADLSFAEPDPALREYLNLPKDQGVAVIDVVPHSPAAAAGIQRNDVLLSLGGGPIAESKDLYELLKKAGDKPVALELVRGGKRMTLQVRPLVHVSLGPVAAKSPSGEYWIGVAVTTIGPVLHSQLRLSQPGGVMVHQVIPDSPAAKAGIAQNDILLSINGKPILNLQDVAAAAQASGGKSLEFSIIGKRGNERKVKVNPARRDPNAKSATPDSRKTLSYDYVHPGVVLDGNQRLLGEVVKETDLQNLQPGVRVLSEPLANLLLERQSNQAQKGQEAPAELTKRLDTLDSDLKELRKLVEELQKSAAKIIERQKNTNDDSSKD